MANSQLDKELKTISTDACTSVANQGDSQAANRLSLDVNNFLHSHAGTADRQALLKTLHGAGIQDDQLAKMEKLGFPTPTISEASDPKQNGNTATEKSAPNEQHKKPTNAGEVIDEINQAEGKFNMLAHNGIPGEDNPGKTALRTALHDAEDFCKNHPEQAKDLLHQLAKGGQLPQLAVAKLDEKTEHLPWEEHLTRGQAVSLLNDGTPLGKELAGAMDSAFSSTQKDGRKSSGYYRDGFADERDSRTKEPTLSMTHLRRDLMTHFDRPPQTPNKEGAGGSWLDTIADLIS